MGEVEWARLTGENLCVRVFSFNMFLPSLQTSQTTMISECKSWAH